MSAAPPTEADRPDARYPGRAQIEAYGNGGFRFGGMSHRGGIISVPSGIYAWSARLPADIDQTALVRVFDEADHIDVLLVGTGTDLVRLPRELQTRLRAAGIMADAMSTGAAVRTFNVILAEDRAVAVALLPVD